MGDYFSQNKQQFLYHGLLGELILYLHLGGCFVPLLPTLPFSQDLFPGGDLSHRVAPAATLRRCSHFPVHLFFSLIYLEKAYFKFKMVQTTISRSRRQVLVP